MATTTKKILRMTFNTSLGQTASITLTEPKAGLTAAEVEAVMDMIIAKNIFMGPYGSLISKNDIKVVDTTTNDIYDEPVA